MLSPALLRSRRRPRPRPRGDRGRRPQPGDLRLAWRLGLQHPRLRRRPSRAGGRRRADVPAHRQPALRPPDPRGRQPARRAALRRVRRQVRAARAQARGAATASSPTARPRDPRTTSWPGWPRACAAAHRRRRAGRGREIGVLTRDNAHAADVFDALTARDVPVEIVGLNGPAAAARGRRGRRHPAPAPRRHRQRLAADPAHRSALGDRAARPRACSAGGPRELAGAPGPRPASPTSVDQLTSRDRRRHRPGRGRLRSATRSTTRATRRTPPRRSSGSRCSRAELRMLRAHVGEPLLDLVRRIIDTTGIDVELASAVSPAAAARRDNLDLFVQGGRGVPGRRRRRDAARAAGLPDRRGRPGQRPRHRHPDRGRLGQAADRAPGQGPGVGRASSWSGVCETRFPTNRSRTLWTSVARRAAGAAARRRGATCRSSAATTRPRSTPTAPAPGPTTREEELRLGYVAVHPRRAPARRLVVPAGARGPRRFGPSAYQARRPRAARGLGRAVADAGCDEAGQGRPQPLRRRATRRGPGRAPGAGREARAAARGGRAWCAPADPDGRRRRPRHGRGRPGRRLGRRARPAARRGARRPRRRWSTVPLPASLSATALAPAARRPRRRSPASWPGRCRGSRRRRPGSAPASTPGSRPASASRTSARPRRAARAGPTPASTTTPTSPS